jgi:prevent-host-death family protein
VKVNVHAAKTTLSRLIERAHQGEEIIIARGGKPVARLVAISGEGPSRQAGTLKGKVKVPRSFFEPLPEDELAAWEGSKR